MKKIIVATDFSKAAESAANYAAWLAQKISGKVELVHVLGISTTENSLHNWRTLETQMSSSAKDGAARLMETIRNPVEITYTTLKEGPFEEVISKYAVDSKADLVVIGSKGASALTKTLFGSNAISLLNHCPRPVVVVPSGFEFDGINKIAYATDMIHLDEEIKTIARLAKPFEAEIVIFHITDEDARKRDRSNLKEILCRMADYNKIDFKVIRNDDVVAGIEEAIESVKPDLLAMFTHQRDLTDKILGKGVTRQLAFQNQLPMMVINRTTSR
jgi:nucleotide-binding universal stress UspA family protein